MSDQLLGIIYGLASAAIWGSGDFSGGVASKKDNVFTVVFVAQFFGLFMLISLALSFGETFPPTQDLLFGALAGIGGTIGLLSFYSGLSREQMGLFAPLTAVLTSVIPVFAGVIFEGWPSIGQLAGFALAFAAVWFLSFSSGDNQISKSAIWLAISAGLGFSLFFIAIDQADSTSGVFWPLVAARCASIPVLGIILRVRGIPMLPTKGNWLTVALAGILDTGGNIFFALAAQIGRLDIASVLSSLYPAATVLLAWIVLNERLQRIQWVGVALALFALILIAL